MTPRRIAIVAVLVLAAALWWWRSHHADGSQDHAPAAVAVEFTQVRRAAAPVELRAIGSVISPHAVQLRAQVGGVLKEVYFTEGDTVSAGQKLFLIDPAPYEAAAAKARAQLALDRASAAAAQAQFERLKPLAAQEFVTPQEFDNARASADETAAQVSASIAALRSTTIDLERTLIRAPIAGRTGSVAFKAGNLVSAGDATPLVLINEVAQLQVQFAVPGRELAAVREALARGAVPVRISDTRDGTVLAEGPLVFVDNLVDATTGTVMLKAAIDNSAQQLWPGTFVDVQLTLRVDPAALLVPETAVQPGAEGSYVYVVGDDGKAALRTVVIDRQVGPDVVISDGLRAGETIVARAPRNLRPDSPVRDVAKPAPAAGGTPASGTPP